MNRDEQGFLDVAHLSIKWSLFEGTPSINEPRFINLRLTWLISQFKIFHRHLELCHGANVWPRIFELFQDLAGIQAAIPWLQPCGQLTMHRMHPLPKQQSAGKVPDTPCFQTASGCANACWGNGEAANKNRKGWSRGSPWVILVPCWWWFALLSASYLKPRPKPSDEAQVGQVKPSTTTETRGGSAWWEKTLHPDVRPWEYVTACPTYCYQVVVALQL